MTLVITPTAEACLAGRLPMDNVEDFAQGTLQLSGEAERAVNMEKISQHLCSDPTSHEFLTTLRWMIYRIVGANKGITYVQLKKILRGEYGINRPLMDTAISSLTSPTLLGGLTKWRNHRMQDSGSDIGIHLFVMRDETSTFRCWREASLIRYPELESFNPPAKTRSPIRKDNG